MRKISQSSYKRTGFEPKTRRLLTVLQMLKKSFLKSTHLRMKSFHKENPRCWSEPRFLANVIFTSNLTMQLSLHCAWARWSAVMRKDKWAASLYLQKMRRFADAQHISAEFTSRLKQDRQPLPSIVLGANSSSITAIGNDYGFDKVFSRELESLANSNDILISITTSGESQNIYELIKSANKIPIRNWCLSSYKNSKCSQ